MFMSVDFPAPFSPSSACASPRASSKLTRSFARTPGNRFVIPRISRTGASLMRGRLYGCRRRPVSGTTRAGAEARPRHSNDVLLEDRGRRDLARDDEPALLVHRRDELLRDLRADLADVLAAVLQ